MASALYTTQLQAGLGLVAETKALLDLWVPGMGTGQLQEVARESGSFPTITARRLRNIVTECFAPRYLVSDASPAAHLKMLAPFVPVADLMAYWPDRVREKCKTDKSLAIAHDREQLYEPASLAEDGKRKKKGGVE